MVTLIVGLGNPGSQYEKTRHNAGFLFLDEIATSNRVSFSYQSKFKADCAKIEMGREVIHLLKPQTFMNKSGDSVQAYAKYYQIPVTQMLVVHDDLDLELGVVRLKRAGGHGGHNGLRDIFSKIASRDFMRLRIGIGHPGDSKQVSDYVLKKMDKISESEVMDAIYKGIAHIEAICTSDIERVMQTLHSD